MTALRIEQTPSLQPTWIEPTVQKSPNRLGLAGVKDSLCVDKSHSVSKVVEYDCIECIENLSLLVRELGKLVIEELKLTEEDFLALLKEKTLLLKNVAKQAEMANSYGYMEDLASYALIACNFVLGSFLASTAAPAAAAPALFFIASAGLATAGIAIKHSSSAGDIASLFAGEDEELKKMFQENAPIALLALAAALSSAAGGIGTMNPEIFAGFAISQETLALLEQGVSFSSTVTHGATGALKTRHGVTKAGLSSVQDRISSCEMTVEKHTSFLSEIKQELKCCCDAVKQIIRTRSIV